MDGSIRGRILRCTRGMSESEFDSEFCSSNVGTDDSLVCIESWDSLCAVEEDSGNPSSPAALNGSGGKGVVGKRGEASRELRPSTTPARLNGFSLDSSGGLSIAAFRWPSGAVKSRTNILKITQKIRGSELTPYEGCNLVLRSARIEPRRSPLSRR